MKLQNSVHIPPSQSGLARPPASAAGHDMPVFQGDSAGFARDLGANTMYIRILGHRPPDSRRQNLIEMERKVPQSATLVGPGIGKVQLYAEDKSGLIYDNDTAFVAGCKKGMLSFVLGSDNAYLQILGPSDYAASEEEIAKMAEVVKARIGGTTIYTSREHSILKHHELKLRLDKEIDNASSKSVLLAVLEEYLPTVFSRKNILPFSSYKDALQEAMAGKEDPRAWLIQGALLKLAEMEKEEDGKEKSVAYLKKAVKLGGVGKHFKHLAIKKKYLNPNEYLIIPNENHLKGILLNKHDVACALELHAHYLNKGKALPFFSYDPDTGTVKEVPKPSLEPKAARPGKLHGRLMGLLK